MPEFLAETYTPRSAPAARRAGEAVPAGEPSRHPAPVRLLRAIAVPEDETRFYLYQAPSAAAVLAAMTAPGPAAENEVMTGLARPWYLPPRLPLGG